jgi:hypothetical protein
MGTKVFFFFGNQCLPYDRAEDAADPGTRTPIGTGFPRMLQAGFGTGVDAALNWGDGKIYFFKNDLYVRYNTGAIGAKGVDPTYPRPIADNWPGMADAGFGADLDAAINWGNGKVYFFKGDAYVRYNTGAIEPEGVDLGYPLKIRDKWPGMAAAGFPVDGGFANDLDAAINWGNGKAYFFKGDQYVRYDMIDDRVDPGYPLVTADHWPGLDDAGLAINPKACVDDFGGKDLFIPGAELVPCPESGPKFINVPWRGILHTTEGPTADGAIAQYRVAGNVFPHLTIDFATLRVVQHLPLNRGSRAVGDGGVAANASNAIQIEIVGKAAESQDWPPEKLAFIKAVMQQVDELVPIPRSTSRVFLRSPFSAAEDLLNRMNAAEWARFTGWCGHQHVPGNLNRSDPGMIDIDFLLAR